tara:strand:+ start:5214 stop:5414 length:201 start_codon:yes stop_codon:yes gene_type:complete
MKIKKILTQNRRDFTATLICEHCEHEENLSGGYDDVFYHRKVIPSFACGKCGKKRADDYRPLTTDH